MPAAFVIAILAGGILSMFFFLLRGPYFLGLSFYIFLVFIFSISKESKELRLIPLVFSGIILTHSTYGIFIKGVVF